MKNHFTNWSLLLFLAIIWGSSFVLMKMGMFTANGQPVFSSVQVGSLRMFFASTALVPLGILTLIRLNSLRDYFSLILVGLCGNFFPAFLFTYAETGISSGLAGILNSGTPLFTIAITFLIYGKASTRYQLLGVALGSLGLYLLLRNALTGNFQADWLHPAAVVLATLCYAISLTTIKYRLGHLTSIQITTGAFTLIWLPSIFLTWYSQAFNTAASHPNSYSSLISIGVLSLVGTVTAVFLFNILIKRSSTLFASSVTYFIPLVAVALGTLSGEHIHYTQLIAMVVVLSGVFLIHWGAKK